MSHIELQEKLPGMRALQTYRPETAGPLNALAHILLRDNGGLSSGDRELIGTFVSSQNDCYYCQTIHGAVAARHLGGNEELIAQTKEDYLSAPLSDKLKTLLTIAGQVRQGGKNVTAEAIAAARNNGATDLEIHDTVLIAAAFCMFNRYVDGLGTWAPEDPQFYRDSGEYLAENGYSTAATAPVQLS